MSLSIPYDVVEQVNMRLVGSTILVQNEPAEVIACRKVGKTMFIQVAYLPKKTVVDELDLTDPQVNIREFKLGYVNYMNEALYLSRIPARQQVQGLCGRNVHVPPYSRENARVLERGEHSADFNRLRLTAEFRDAIRGIYPSLQEAIAMLDNDDDRISVAFGRCFALKKDKDLEFFELLYKGDRVAWGDPNNFNLPSSSSFLREVLEESRINYRR